jgi:putative transposase
MLHLLCINNLSKMLAFDKPMLYLCIVLMVYKYRLYPDEGQKVLLEKHFGCVRFIYNLALETKVSAYLTHKVNLSRYDLSVQLKELKQDCEWLKEVNSQSLQSALLNLDIAYRNFFKWGSGFPKFKKKGDKQSFQCPQHVTISGDGLHLLKFKQPIKIVLHRKFKGDIKTVTISKTPTNKYFAFIRVDNHEPMPTPIKDSKNIIGIDLGIKSFIITSDGQKYDNPKYLRKSLDRMKWLQRRFSRKQKGSKRREVSRLRVAKLHEKISNQRYDFLHKVSDAITKQYDIVCMENLQVANMLKNHRLALSIKDCGWGTFESMLKYKCEWRGKQLIQIGTFEPSSKTCCECGYINKDLILADREWTCPSCGTVLDRDICAAKNILSFGIRDSGMGHTFEDAEPPAMAGTLKRQKFIMSDCALHG